MEISTPGRPKRFIAIGNFNHTHGQINIRKQKTSQKKGGDKVNNKEKRKDTKVKKVYQ